MPGVKGKSGRKDIPAGPGRIPQKFSLELGKEYGVSRKIGDKFMPIQLARVVEIDRKIIVLETQDGDRVTIFR